MRGYWRGIALAGVAALALGAATGMGAGMVTSHPMGDHMAMTELKPVQPGDKERADAILAGAKRAAARYVGYKTALANGYFIFMPNLPQKVYHFAKADGESASFDPADPPALLYRKTKDGYSFAGVMYMAPWNATDEDLNAKVPLSIAQWHAHTNLCVPPAGNTVNWIEGDPTFGLDGSIKTAEACRAAGGRFQAHLAGWMVHVYPNEEDPEKIWKPGLDEDHDSMKGMKM